MAGGSGMVAPRRSGGKMEGVAAAVVATNARAAHHVGVTPTRLGPAALAVALAGRVVAVDR